MYWANAPLPKFLLSASLVGVIFRQPAHRAFELLAPCGLQRLVLECALDERRLLQPDELADADAREMFLAIAFHCLLIIAQF